MKICLPIYSVQWLVNAIDRNFKYARATFPIFTRSHTMRFLVTQPSTLGKTQESISSSKGICYMQSPEFWGRCHWCSCSWAADYLFLLGSQPFTLPNPLLGPVPTYMAHPRARALFSSPHPQLTEQSLIFLSSFTDFLAAQPGIYSPP